jgi:hypothetical protein
MAEGMGVTVVIGLAPMAGALTWPPTALQPVTASQSKTLPSSKVTGG